MTSTGRSAPPRRSLVASSHRPSAVTRSSASVLLRSTRRPDRVPRPDVDYTTTPSRPPTSEPMRRAGSTQRARRSIGSTLGDEPRPVVDRVRRRGRVRVDRRPVSRRSTGRAGSPVASARPRRTRCGEVDVLDARRVRTGTHPATRTCSRADRDDPLRLLGRHGQLALDARRVVEFGREHEHDDVRFSRSPSTTASPPSILVARADVVTVGPDVVAQRRQALVQADPRTPCRAWSSSRRPSCRAQLPAELHQQDAEWHRNLRRVNRIRT